MSSVEDLAEVQRNRTLEGLPPLSDEGLALKFAERNKPRLRYVPAWGKWMVYEGGVWKKDDRLRAFTSSRTICREVAAGLNDAGQARAVASSKTVAAVERMARADEILVAGTDQWDTDPMLLNTPECVIDLETGLAQPHRLEDFCTKQTAVSPTGTAPLWMKFLVDVTANDQGLITYLQRLCGYGLTGIIREHILAFAYGRGGNGKSVFINTVSGVMGSYHENAPMETFMASAADRHPTELAKIATARLVTSVETEQGRRWKESRIKELTGGEKKISVRFMRQDFFEVQPCLKLIFVGNYKPELRGTDDGWRRRFNLIPFTVRFDKPDLDLERKLQNEWPGILQWMIDGAVDWHKNGLNPPAVVRDATAEYFADEDSLQQWIEERCERDMGFEARASDLYGSWKSWAEANGAIVGSNKDFSHMMQNKGYRKKHDNRGTAYVGISVRPNPDHTWQD